MRDGKDLDRITYVSEDEFEGKTDQRNPADVWFAFIAITVRSLRYMGHDLFKLVQVRNTEARPPRFVESNDFKVFRLRRRLKTITHFNRVRALRLTS